MCVWYDRLSSKLTTTHVSKSMNVLFIFKHSSSFHLNYRDIYYWWGQKSFCPDNGGHESLIRTSPDQTSDLIWHYRLITDDKMTCISLWIIGQPFSHARLASFIVPNILISCPPGVVLAYLAYCHWVCVNMMSTLPTKTALAEWHQTLSLPPRASSSVAIGVIHFSDL